MTENYLCKRYVSTVFPCDVSGDTRYIRCDFNQCREHAKTEEGYPWILNTTRNVKLLEQHVGKEIDNFLTNHESNRSRDLFETNQDVLHIPEKLAQFTKILVVYNLRDPQSQFGNWISKFIEAGHRHDGSDGSKVLILTLSFISRFELLSSIEKLNLIPQYAPSAQVLVVLSCHSSSQGQVFSCTPTKYSQEYKFEEFCSLHDFVKPCQDVLGSTLHGIHISSCFALKLDCSHKDWPVDYSWLAKDLLVPLVGSVKEVYETGSQIADLYLMASLFCGTESDHGDLKQNLKAMVYNATQEDFPDLSREMGLVEINTSNLDSLVELPSCEDKVSLPTKVSSTVHLVLMSSKLDSGFLLAEAVMSNLEMRNQSDIQCLASEVRLQDLFNENEMFRQLSSINFEDRKPFFVILSKSLGSACRDIAVAVKNWVLERKICIYGVHFQSLEPTQGFALKRVLNPSAHASGRPGSYPFTVTACLEENKVKAYMSFSLLLYVIHLSIGENGLREYWTKKDIKKKLLASCWTLEDVYMETSYVLSGLSRKCRLLMLHKLQQEMTSIEYEASQDLFQGNCTSSNGCYEAEEVQLPCISRLTGIQNVSEVENEEPLLADAFATSVYKDSSIDIENSSNEIENSSNEIENSSNEIDNAITEIKDAGNEIKDPGNEIRESRNELYEAGTQLTGLAVDVSIGNMSCGRDECAPRCGSNPPNARKQNYKVLDGHKNSHPWMTGICSESQKSSTNRHFQPEKFSMSPCQNSTDSTQCIIENSACIKPSSLYDSKETEVCRQSEHSHHDKLEHSHHHKLDHSNHDNLEHSHHDKLEHSNYDKLEHRINSDDAYDQDMCASKGNVNDLIGAGNLPLMANVDEVLVSHYILDLEVNFDSRVIRGNILLFLTPTSNKVATKKFQMCLDSSLTDVESVEEVDLPDDFEICFHCQKCCCVLCGSSDSILNQYEGKKQACSNCFFLQSLRSIKQSNKDLKYKLLPYSVGGWCIRVWKSGPDATFWPKCVRISYKTSPEGPSLEWSKDQDGLPCVFTPGAYINNRSFMPCQEPPVAMSTWQAFIKVPTGCKVLMSGNGTLCKPVYCMTDLDEFEEFYYEMPIALPCTTLALSIGYYVAAGHRLCMPSAEDRQIPITFYAAPSAIDKFVNEFSELALVFLDAACELLGKYPFSRLDLILMPPNFACMGLKSPNLAFLSQSLLCGDKSMAVRVAHEISHAWFGLLLGAKDWTEEWLSEGFATYIEDRIQAMAMQWNIQETDDRCELRRLLRYRTLEAEIREAVDDNMKQLRPERQTGNYLSAVEAVKVSMENDGKDLESNSKVKPHTVVKWGAIPSRKWNQVHYLKGYFLLHYMSTLVGVKEFDSFLKKYIVVYGGSLVTSEMFFDLFIKTFNLDSELKSKLINEWLESPRIPKVLESFKASSSNRLVAAVEKEFLWWKNNDSANKRCKSRGVKRRKLTNQLERPFLDAEQLVLLLEKMLERETIAVKTISQLRSAFNLSKQNAEVRHRWCELIIKHKYSRAYDEVDRFLREDQGMGIYLFGELMISENPTLQRLATRVFADIGADMDKCTYQTVYEMLNGI